MRYHSKHCYHLLTLLLLTSPQAFSQEASADEELTEEEIAAAEAEAEASEEEGAEEKESPKTEGKEGEASATTPPKESAEEGAAEVADEGDASSDTEGEEEPAFEPGQEPNRPPPKGKGVVWGRIVDAKDGEPAIEAQVKVLGTKVEVFTDFDGYFRLELPPGKYRLQIFYDLHEPETADGVTVSAGQVNRLDSRLKPQAGAVEEVLIEDEAETQTVEGLALARQRSVSAGDAVGREEISKTTDSNAAEAAQRVVGANIVGGRFVYVRGLGERYSNSLLSMYPLPSPEPDRAAVPLDVFPATVLDSLTIAKTFTPDMPADFAGGSVQIETRSVPTKPLFSLQLTGGINTQSTFQSRLDSPNSATDWLGFDSGMRKLPSSVPEGSPLTFQAERPDGTRTTREQLVRAGQDMNSPMSPKMADTLPNHAFTVVGGDTLSFSGGQKLGYLASLNYSRKFEKYEDVVVREFWPSGTDERGFAPRVDYKMDRGVDQVRWGAFGKVSYLPSDDHKFTLTGFHSQLADDITSLWQGTNYEISGAYAATQLDWIERGLTFGVLSGRHEFDSLGKSQLDWDVSIARAYRAEPDRRDTVYQQNSRIPDPENPRERLLGWTYINKTESGRHFWADQAEDSNGGKIDYRQPLASGDHELALKLGSLLNVKQRSFVARRFQMLPEDAYRNQAGSPYHCLGENYRLNCPDGLFENGNFELGENGEAAFLRVAEGSQQGDAYDANLNVFAGYAMLDWDIKKRLRIAAGARVETTDQRIDPRSPVGDRVTIDGANLSAVDALPAISLVYSATEKAKTRLSFTQTLARPQLRELAPFAFSDYFGGRLTSGNPDLTLTRITNLDARFEFWPSLSEVLAFTAFFKHLEDPIETILVPSGGNPQVTFRNSPGANLLGAEFEVRKNLGFVSSVLDPFSVISNFTLAWSRTEIVQTGQQTLTSLNRPLVNQAPWVFNAALDYESTFGTTARLIYNVNGPTLVEVGTDTLPDGYRHPFHSLDFTVSQKLGERWTARGSVENLTNDDVVVTQGSELLEENIARQYTLGTIFSLGIGYSL